MKNTKLYTAVICLSLVLATLFSLSACMNEDDYYTKDDISSLIEELRASLSDETSEIDEAVKALTDEYEAKIAELEAEDEATKAEIDSLNTEYAAKIALLEKADKDNAAALTKLKTDYEEKVKALEESISSNSKKIASLETELQNSINSVKADYDKKVADIQSLITALQETDTSNVKSLATLEAQMKELLSKHEHSFGEWINFAGNESVYCESRLFYRICKDCSVLEWKHGTYDEHKFTTVTIEPTCESEGYDKKTCSTCGKVEKLNYTDIAKHKWSKDGICTACGAVAYSTEGVKYEVSSDGSYAKVIGYSGAATKIRIVDEYEGVPVRSIYSEAFKGTDIVSIIIPECVETIGENAFQFCSALESISFGENSQLSSIGECAFFDCYSLTSIEVPNGVTSIGDSAFKYSALKSVSFGENSKLSSIGDFAFSTCNLTSFEIPNGVTSIGAYAFEGGSISSTSIEIPSSVTSIDVGAFEGCYFISVTFENTEGWSCKDNSRTVSISSSDLSDTETAANYLIDTYSYFVWERS